MFCLYFTLLAIYLGTVHGAFSCQEAKKDYSAPVCIQDGYDAFRLPFTDKPNLITVNLGVDSVIGIDEKDFSFTFAGYMNLQWKEPRLEIRNNNHSGLVPVDAGIIEELWLPNVFIYNLKTLEVIEVLSKMTGKDEDLINFNQSELGLMITDESQVFYRILHYEPTARYWIKCIVLINISVPIFRIIL